MLLCNEPHFNYAISWVIVLFTVTTSRCYNSMVFSAVPTTAINTNLYYL